MRILKIKSLFSKKKQWVDKDEMMLHACFQLLVDFIEDEKGDTHCDYEAHKELVDEIRFLYNWWKKRKDMEFEFEQHIEDDKMLIRLMKIRTCLWT